MRSLSQQVEDLNEAYEELKDDYAAIDKERDELIELYQDLQAHVKNLEEELEWYHATFPEGSDAYACMRRME